MLYYLKKYPLTLSIIGIILYLSFFTPPQTEMENIPGIDKIVHTCMYGGLCLLLWVEYFRIHQTINRLRMLIGGIILPIAFSGSVELLQHYCTVNRGGEWLDFAANSLGVILAALVGFHIIRPFFGKQRKRNAGDSHEQPTQ